MKLILIITLLSLVSCGTGSGKNDDTSSIGPSTTTAPCDGDVTFNTSIPDEGSNSFDSDDSNDDLPGIINPAVSKALDAAKYQGLRVVSLQKLDGVTIIGTCDATINVNVDSGNSSVVPVSE